MPRIRNVPGEYKTRASLLPKLGHAKKTAEREASYLTAPIDDSFYIHHRQPK